MACRETVILNITVDLPGPGSACRITGATPVLWSEVWAGGPTLVNIDDRIIPGYRRLAARRAWGGRPDAGAACPCRRDGDNGRRHHQRLADVVRDHAADVEGGDARWVLPRPLLSRRTAAQPCPSFWPDTRTPDGHLVGEIETHSAPAQVPAVPSTASRQCGRGKPRPPRQTRSPAQGHNRQVRRRAAAGRRSRPRRSFRCRPRRHN